MATMTSMHEPKKEGDISDAFASMSGKDAQPLPDKFRQIKLGLVQGREAAVEASWKRLLRALKEENKIVAQKRSSVIPDVRYHRLEEDLAQLQDELKKRGVAVIRGVIPEKEARAYKFQTEEYVKKNPQTKGFPKDDPQVFELYWSPAQIAARSHPNLLKTQRALMQHLWHVPNSASRISLSTPLTYADRLRIRQPGDAAFALGPHQDGGSVERWEPDGYGRGGVYEAVFAGRWEEYDPWDAGRRVDVKMNLYEGLGPCNMFRAFQGWLSMSNCGPEKGTLLVNPLVRLSMVYALLRPFFKPVREVGKGVDTQEAFLEEENWVFTGGEKMNSDLQGAHPGHGQELSEAMHPHLELENTIIHIPDVRPGDYVVWHCDTIHAVDSVHKGDSDSSVLYIPVCPTTESNARYLTRQREAFLAGTPGPDFPGGKGESEHVDRPLPRDIASLEALQSMGLAAIDTRSGLSPGETQAIKAFNQALSL